MQQTIYKRLWVVIIVLFWGWLFTFGPAEALGHRLKTLYQQWMGVEVQQNDASSEAPVLAITPSDTDKQSRCDKEMPAHATQFKFSGGEATLKSRLHINNEHLYPVALTFSELDKQQAYGAVLLHPNQAVQLSMPIGRYSISLAAGEVWCNVWQGFKNGATINPDQQLVIKPNQVANVRLMPFGGGAENVMVSLSSSLGLVAGNNGQTIEGHGVLMLQRVVGGHYVVEGTINQVPVTFMVDTGATSVAVSDNFAKHAGITECRKAKTRTANGVADICIANVRELSFGQFKLSNVEINYGKGMADDVFLLGMNVIGLLKMEQQGDVMKLSR